ncbi:MAG: uroporphyrinogen-III synthase [Actinomycetota bacterium]|nr:uroporphyrinogen-III synthase [Actinomycetota bacterium]
MTDETRLLGRTIGVTADRRGDDQAVMWRRLGAEVIRGAAIRSEPVADRTELHATVSDLIAAPPEHLVANTGYGMRALFALVEEWGEVDRFRAAIGHARVVARGPKAAGAVRSLGLDLAWRSPSEQLAEVAEHLIDEGIADSRVAFQLHGDDAAEFTASLEGAGATVVALPIYRWARPGDDQAPLGLIDACCAGRVDALTFTSAPGVRNFMAVADAAGRSGELTDAARRMVIGCVGPVCAAAAEEEGFADVVVPDAWRLGSLVRAVTDAVVARPAVES